MEAIPQCFVIWEQVAGIRAAIIAHRAYLILRAARRIPAHRHLPHDQFVTGVAFKLLQVHPAAASMTLRWLGLPVLMPSIPIVPLHIRGFSAGSYTGATVSLIAPLISSDFHCMVQLGAIAMAPAILIGLCRLVAQNTQAEGLPHRVALVHVAGDSLCSWTPGPAFAFLASAVHVSYLTGPLLRKGPNWLGMRKRNYGHLLTVPLPEGERTLQSLLCQEPSARPLADQIRVPLRLTSWLRRTSRVPLENIVALLHLPSAEMVQQISTVLPPTERNIPTTEEEAKTALLHNFSIHLSARAQDTTLEPIEIWLSQLARNLLQPMPLAELIMLLHAFIPQISYGTSARIAAEAKRSTITPGSTCTFTPSAKGPLHLHEFQLQHHAPSYRVLCSIQM